MSRKSQDRIDARELTKSGCSASLGLDKSGGKMNKMIQGPAKGFLKKNGAQAGDNAHNDTQQRPTELPGPAVLLGIDHGSAHLAQNILIIDWIFYSTDDPQLII